MMPFLAVAGANGFVCSALRGKVLARGAAMRGVIRAPCDHSPAVCLWARCTRQFWLIDTLAAARRPLAAGRNLEQEVDRSKVVKLDSEVVFRVC